MLSILLQAACASSPPSDAHVRAVGAPAAPAESPPGTARTDPPQSFRLDIDAAAPFVHESGGEDDNALASGFSIGIDSLIRYRASWSVEPGDLLAAESPPAYTQAPTRFGGQYLGQNVNLLLPEVAGAPFLIELRAETESDWMVDGSTESQRERAKLNWSPGPATVNVQWVGTAAAFDDSIALSCDLQSTLRLPTHEGSDHSEWLRFSGRDCIVPDEGTHYGGIEAQTWGMSYVWDRPRRQSEARLSVIDPSWPGEAELAGIGPGYELGLRHRRTFGALSASALVSLRRIPAMARATIADSVYGRGDDTAWSANASLQWQLADASLSANWATGIDRLWFAPDAGQQSDQFGLALNLSRWIETLMPRSAPQLAMNWEWSEVRLPTAGTIGSNSVRLDVALMF